jgi:hypothetical protein
MPLVSNRSRKRKTRAPHRARSDVLAPWLLLAKAEREWERAHDDELAVLARRAMRGWLPKLTPRQREAIGEQTRLERASADILRERSRRTVADMTVAARPKHCATTGPIKAQHAAVRKVEAAIGGGTLFPSHKVATDLSGRERLRPSSTGPVATAAPAD